MSEPSHSESSRPLSETQSIVPTSDTKENHPAVAAEISSPSPSRGDLWWLQAKDDASTGLVELGHGIVLSLRGLGKLLSAAALSVGVGVFRLIGRWRKAPMTMDDDAVEMDLRALESRLPTLSPSSPRMALYNVPVRLVTVVVAPAGNHRPLRGYQELAMAMELAVPGLARVLKSHSPKIVLWASQLSTSGFAAKFHCATPFPDDPTTAATTEQEYALAAGTRWCSVVGPMLRADQNLLVGMICVAETLTTVGRATVEQPHLWRTICSVAVDSTLPQP